MPEKTRSLLDSFALLAFLNKESGFEKVRSLLREAQRSNKPLLMNEINIGEVYYITAKNRSFELADEFLNRLETLSVEAVPNSFAHVLEAARLKARFPVSYVDAFAVTTAMRMDAAIVTGDPEFRQVEHLITVNWL